MKILSHVEALFIVQKVKVLEIQMNSMNSFVNISLNRILKIAWKEAFKQTALVLKAQHSKNQMLFKVPKQLHNLLLIETSQEQITNKKMLMKQTFWKQMGPTYILYQMAFCQ